MKLVVQPTVKLAVATGIAIVFLGCRAESTQASEQITAAVAAPIAEGSLSANAQPTAAPLVLDNLVTAPATLSPGLQDVIDLAQGGLGDEVILAFIASWPQPFNLTSEEILYLTDLGISEAVIAAMIKHLGGAGTGEMPAEHKEITMPPPAGPSGTELSPGQPSVAITATPEFEAGVQPAPDTIVVAPPPDVPTEHHYFYSALSPYGSWIEVPDYGVLWRPTVAVINPGWTPYSDRGRWIYSDVGWYWQSDYSWGWAPFHYGRWWMHPHHGWVWAPDRVWGPAWVTWRYSDAYCGWAPLPPGAYVSDHFGLTYHGSRVSIGFSFGLGYSHYTFVPVGRFYDRSPWRHRVGHTQVVNVFNRTKVINNIITQNNVVINEGISRDRITAVSRTEIPKVSVRELPGNGDRSVRPDRIDRRGSELVVYRPQLPPAGENTPARKPQEGARVIPSRAALAPDAAVSRGPRAGTAGLASGSRSQFRSELPGKQSEPVAGKTGAARDATSSLASIPSRPAGALSAEATENRGRSVSKPQLIRTPLQPSYREIPRVATAPTVPSISRPITAADSPASSRSTYQRSIQTPLAQRSAPQRSPSEISKTIESRRYVPASRGFPTQQNPATTVIPSRRSYSPAISPQSTIPSAASSYSPSVRPPISVPQPLPNVSSASRYRQELQKPPSSIYTRKQVVSPSVSSIPSRSTFGAPAPNAFSSRTIPSMPSRPSFTPPAQIPRVSQPPNIRTVPSRAPSTPPMAIRPSQLTPSMRSAPPASSSPSVRSRGGRSEIRK